MTRRMLPRIGFLALLLLGLVQACGTARAEEWTDYYHWPYAPPQYPGNGFNSGPLYDGWYLYPRPQRIVPQIQGPYYYNFYGGKRVLGCRSQHGLFYQFHDWDKNKFYFGNHFILDVF